MHRLLTDTKLQGLLTLGFVLLFAVVGLVIGAPPASASRGTFGDVLRAFASADQTRSILCLIVADVITGVIAALRVGSFDGQKLARFYASNIIPYTLGYMLFWFLTYFGLAAVLPALIVESIGSFGYAAIMATLTQSIIDNIVRARTGVAAPEGAPVYASVPTSVEG